VLNLTWDPLDPVLLLFEPIWLGIAVGLMLFSGRVKSEWVRASLAGLGLSILGMRLLAILPSWWLYFADGALGWGGQGCVELDLSCLKQAAKDTVVVVQNAVVLGAFVVGFIIWQKKHPKQLAPGESKPEGGGYK
jgi:hypothetical protein